MALTDAQKTQVRRYLGFPDIYRASHQDLEGAWGALSSDGETFVGSLLTQLAAVQTALQDAWSRQKVSKAEEVTLTADGELRAMRMEGKRLALELGQVFGIAPKRDVFQAGGGSGTFPTG